ncbi:MAG: selenite/tellurite reduction operon b-type cytochrome iron-sulfur cluster-binding subunit ExtO [Thermoanaerobaculia bacterium]
MTRWVMLCIAAFSLISGSRVSIEAHSPALLEPDASSRACLACHLEAGQILSGPMAMRSGERAFAHRAFGFEEGERFFAESCSGCHVTSCSDCHGDEAHPTSRPRNEACLQCHRGYSAGWEFEGKAPREDHARYQRGATSQGEPFLRMLPDIHFERGLVCADCHPMESLHTGGRAKGCLDCHPSPSSSVPEHAIPAHMSGMQCVACHAAWAPQEYGTFLVRPATTEQEEAFAPLRKWGSWQKSAHLKRQDPPPLGVDLSGRVAPIRPRFILLMSDPARGIENRLLAAEWRAFTPHTVRRGSVPCGGCHDNARRFLLEADDERIHLPDIDGIGLRSYWNREGQSVVNGAFISPERHTQMNTKSPEYARQVVNQWKNILNHAAPHSGR